MHRYRGNKKIETNSKVDKMLKSNINAAQMYIFISTIVTQCKVKDTARMTCRITTVPLSSTQHVSVYQLVVVSVLPFTKLLSTGPAINGGKPRSVCEDRRSISTREPRISLQS